MAAQAAQARVKRCGKSAPAPEVTRVARQTPSGARSDRGRTARPQTPPGRPLEPAGNRRSRGMAAPGRRETPRTESGVQADSPPTPYGTTVLGHLAELSPQLVLSPSAVPPHASSPAIRASIRIGWCPNGSVGRGGRMRPAAGPPLSAVDRSFRSGERHSGEGPGSRSPGGGRDRPDGGPWAPRSSPSIGPCLVQPLHGAPRPLRARRGWRSRGEHREAAGRALSGALARAPGRSPADEAFRPQGGRRPVSRSRAWRLGASSLRRPECGPRSISRIRRVVESQPSTSPDNRSTG